MHVLHSLAAGPRQVAQFPPQTPPKMHVEPDKRYPAMQDWQLVAAMEQDWQFVWHGKHMEFVK